MYESSTNEAPPTKAPSISGCSNNAFKPSGLTDPPYWILTWSATSCPYNSATTERIYPQTSWAISFVAVFPVPIAHTGS